MAEITAKLVKELREKSGAGVMDAKKALVEVDGDIEKATQLAICSRAGIPAWSSGAPGVSINCSLPRK